VGCDDISLVHRTQGGVTLLRRVSPLVPLPYLGNGRLTTDPWTPEKRPFLLSLSLSLSLAESIPGACTHVAAGSHAATGNPENN
jgi:hypothetical protein